MLILSVDHFRDGVEMNVVGAFVDGADFAVAIEFFDGELFGEANAAHPFDAFGGSFGGYISGVEFGHASFFNERLAGFLQASGVVNHETRGFNVGGDVSDLMLHALEVDETLTKLFAVLKIGNGVIKTTLCETNHLSANSNTASVQDFNGVFVA